MEKKLGKGLDALITQDISKPNKKVAELEVHSIVPNRFQPRKQFSEQKLKELESSIREEGILQPILVRGTDDEGKFELIAGERRWRAAQKAGRQTVPAIIRSDIDDAKSLEISIVENMQRDELNPIEEARGFQGLINEFSYTLERIGQIMGKGKSTISNSLRLLSLPQEVLEMIKKDELSTGHAKALLSVPNENRLKQVARTIVEKGLSVREAEQLVKKEPGTKTRNAKKDKAPEVLEVEEKLQNKYGTKVDIVQGKKRGRIQIQYFSNEDLDRVLSLLL